MKLFFTRKFNTTSILILSFCALITIPMVLVSVIYYVNEKNSIEDTSLQYENQIFDDLDRDFDTLLKQYGEAKYEISSQFLSLDIAEINYDSLRTEDMEKIKLLENLLQSIRRVTIGVTNLYVYSTQDIRASYSSTFAFDKAKLIYSRPTDVYDSGGWDIIRNHAPTYSFGNKRYNVYSFTTGLIDTDFNGEFDYFLQIDTGSSYFAQRFQTMATEDTDYLVDNVKSYLDDHFAWSKPIWDVGAIGYLVNPAWAESKTCPAPLISETGRYSFDPRRHLIRSLLCMDRDAIFKDMFQKLLEYK